MKRSRKLLFSILPLAALILAGESICRVKFYYDHERDLVYLLAPFGLGVDRSMYSPCRGRKMLRSYFRADGFLWRGAPFSQLKRPEVYRILVVGGSTVESRRNVDKDTWVYLVGKLLNSEPGLENRIEVINGGKSSYNTEMINAFLLEKGFKLNPDMVLYYEAINDQNKFFNFGLIGDNIKNNTVAWLHEKLYNSSMLYTYLVERIHFALPEKNIERNLSLEDGSTLVRENFLEIIKNCRQRMIEFVYVKQVIDYPLEKEGRDLTDQNVIVKRLEEEYRRSWRKGMDARFEIYALTQRLINSIQSEVCRQQGILVIDPLPVFEQARRAQQKLFFDICHTNCHGERILADCVYEGLRDVVRQTVFQRPWRAVASGGGLKAPPGKNFPPTEGSASSSRF